VWLDARHLGAERLKSRFPLIWQTCADAGYDLSKDLLPVVPAAHYLVGGVRVDVDGRTSIPGLFASGEVAASGLHGANRLASNSLLEGLVFSRRIARALESEPRPRIGPQHSEPAEKGRAESAPQADPAAARADLQSASAAFLGMGRTEEGLKELLDVIAGLAAREFPRTAAGMEALNLLTVASLSASAAILREESRGCHSRLDFPERDDAKWRAHIVFTKGEPPVIVDVADDACPSERT
jgi:L-aspartate oxidase